MLIHRNETHFRFSFEGKEWGVCKGAAVRAFINELKDRIPRDQRDFNSSINEWTISIGFVSVFEELRKKYFTDKRQGALF